MVKLTNNERACMEAWRYEQYGWDYMSFAAIDERCTLPKHLIRRTTRQLSRKGLVELANRFTDDGMVCGRGYGTTPEGRTYLKETGDQPPQKRYINYNRS